MYRGHRMPRGFARSLLVSVVLGSVLAAGLSGAAQASTSRDASTADPAGAQSLAACVFDVGYTIKDGSYIRGSGSYTKCNTFWRITVQLKRDRWYGPQVLDTATRTTSGSVGVSWYCPYGIGTYTYYTVVTAYHYSGARSAYKTSNKLTRYC
jgi:hypothetical protein